MTNNCILCGSPLVEGKCPNAAQHFKPMCLNCESCQLSEDGFVCVNETNNNAALEKVKAALPAGYEFKALELKPLALKDPTKKCKGWELLNDTEKLIVELKKSI